MDIEGHGRERKGSPSPGQRRSHVRQGLESVDRTANMFARCVYISFVLPWHLSSSRGLCYINGTRGGDQPISACKSQDKKVTSVSLGQ